MTELKLKHKGVLECLQASVFRTSLEGFAWVRCIIFEGRKIHFE